MSDEICRKRNRGSPPESMRRLLGRRLETMILGVLVLTTATACHCQFVDGDPADRHPVTGYRTLPLGGERGLVVLFFGGDWDPMDDRSLKGGLYAVAMHPYWSGQAGPEWQFRNDMSSARLRLRWPADDATGEMSTQRTDITISIDVCRSRVGIGSSDYDVLPGTVLLVAIDESRETTTQKLTIQFSEDDSPEDLVAKIEVFCRREGSNCQLSP